MNDLMDKLAASKRFIDAMDKIPRSSTGAQQVREVAVPQQSQQVATMQMPSNGLDAPVVTHKSVMSSNLPDEIKEMMLTRPETPTASYADSISEGIKKKMGAVPVKESVPDGNTDLRRLIKEVMVEVLEENNLIVGEDQSVKERMQFRLGKTVFDGQITKMRKLK